MTQEEIVLVKRSWKMFRHVDPELVGSVFYGKLFSDHPSLRKLFKDSIESQSRKLVDMLTYIVTHLDNLESLKEDIRALAERHRGYGVRPSYYNAVETALLWTLEQGLGVDWNADVRSSWISCYRVLAGAMLETETRH